MSSRVRRPGGARALAPPALVLAGIAIYSLWGRPLGEDTTRLAERVAARHEQLQWMAQASRTLRRHRPADGSPGARGGRGESLLALVERSARAGSVAIDRMQPAGDDAVSISLARVRFDALLAWLAGLGAQQGVSVSALRLEQGGEPGLVSAELVLARRRAEAAPGGGS